MSKKIKLKDTWYVLAMHSTIALGIPIALILAIYLFNN